MSDTDAVTVSTVVAVDPSTAFAVFTDEIDTWWRRDRRYRAEGDRSLRFEPGPGGRLVAYQESGAVFEVGRVLDWRPAERLVFEWRSRSFAPGERTEVEVRFAAVPGGTRVTLEHRGWDALPPDHPVRHGLSGPAFVSMFGLWWADLLTALRAHSGRR